MDTIKVKINDKEYNLLVAKTEEEKEIGLQNVESMNSDEGMWFSYEEDPQDELTFWMKDTTLELNIIFVNDDYEVIKVLKGEPESLDYLTCEAPKNSSIIAVIELNASEKVNKGDGVEVLDDSDYTDLPKNGMFVLNDDGSVQFDLGSGGSRIFSRISSRVIIRKFKKAAKSKSDIDYKTLGRYIFQELKRQDDRDPQYIETPENNSK